MPHAGGRPTKYIPELKPLIEEYLSECTKENMKLPTVEGLCLKLDITRETAYQWKEEHKEFSDTLEHIKVLQKEMLTEVGIFGGKEINANIVALFLKANHDMIEKSAVDVTSGGKPIPILGNVPSHNSNQEVAETTKED